MNGTIIFADGASRGNPGPGGWGAIVAAPDGSVTEIGGGNPHTTNNRMELTAAIEGLEIASRHHAPIVLHTDSRYVINGIEKWVPGWKRNDWITTAKNPVLNKELWERLSELNDKLTVSWKHVAGHAGIPGNERADAIAATYADERRPNLYSGSRTEYGVDLSISGSSKKSAKRVSRPGAAYSYLSLVKGVLVRHTTWAECEKRTKGVRAARFKKALSAEEEKEIARAWGAKLD